MKNQSSKSGPAPNDAQQKADQLIAALENDKTPSHLSQSGKETHVLGQAIRESASTDLPSSQASLRELLKDTIDDSTPTVAPAKPIKPMVPSSRRWLVISASAAALLCVGTIAFLNFPQGQPMPMLSSYDKHSEVVEPELVTADKPEPAMDLEYGSEDQRGFGNGTPAVNLDLKDGLVRGESMGSGGGKALSEDNTYENLDILEGSVGGAPIDARKSPRIEAPATTSISGGQRGMAVNPSEFGDSETDNFGIGTGLVRGSKGFELDGTIKFNKDGSVAEEPRDRDLGRGGLRLKEESSGEQYEHVHENSFKPTKGMGAVSTFSIDVDTASYANMRRFLSRGQRVPPNSVRIEEFVNYFQYDYPQPKGDQLFSVNMEMATCPWNERHKLLRVGLKGKEVHRDERPAANIVFLIDVSGSMNNPDKLPLLKNGFSLMVNALNENDRVSIVTYAGNSKIVLQPTTGDRKAEILAAINNLKSGGSTNGSAGIEMAYQLAQQNFVQEGNNKVILATDGDLNVGVTSDAELVKLIKNKASEGVFLTVLGFGTGNLKDSKMEKLADNGNGDYAYIDGVREAHKVLVEGMSGALVTIAKDVKIQIEFNPAEVQAYRLIGYENRILAAKDFDDDTKDAGEIGAGHTVTALYELVTTDAPVANVEIPQGLRYQKPVEKEPQDVGNLTDQADSNELLTLALRFKQPDSNESEKIEFTLGNEDNSFSTASGDFQFAASVAAFGMILKGSEYCGNATPQWIQEVASGSIGSDSSGYRAEFIDLVRRFHSAR